MIDLMICPGCEMCDLNDIENCYDPSHRGIHHKVSGCSVSTSSCPECIPSKNYNRYQKLKKVYKKC